MSVFNRTMNRFPAMLLRSPLHGFMSKKTLLITFTGRKSGKKYTIPIVYLPEGDAFLMTTDSPWWKSRRGEGGAGTPVTLRLEERDYPGVARVLEMMLREYPSYGRFVGLKSGDHVGRVQIEEIARERVVIRCRLGTANQNPGHRRGER